MPRRKPTEPAMTDSCAEIASMPLVTAAQQRDASQAPRARGCAGLHWNCPGHTPVTIDHKDVQRARDQRDTHIAQLQVRLARRAAGPPGTG
jgi:hypothetical protein